MLSEGLPGILKGCHVTRIKGQLTTADYLPIAEYNRLVRGLEKDGEYLWETYCWLSFCTGMAGPPT